MKRYFTWILTLVLALGCVQCVCAAPNETDITSAGHSYRLVVSDCTWQQAFQNAAAAGGHLATFETADEFNAIITQITQAGLSSIMFRIGGRRDLNSTQYNWTDSNNNLTGVALNNPSSWANSVWMQGEPSFQDGDIQEAFMDLFYYQKEGRWVFNDVPDDIISIVPGYSGKIGYIIEFDSVPAAQSAAASWQDAYRAFIFGEEYLNTPDASYGDGISGDLGGISFALRDMDADGTPELLIYNGDSVYAGNASYLYYYSGGEVCYADIMPGPYYYKMACVDEYGLPGIFASGAHMGDYWTECSSFNGSPVDCQRVWSGSMYTPGSSDVNTDPATGEEVITDTFVTDNETLYNAYLLIKNDEGRNALPFSTIEEINEIGWDGYLSQYGYSQAAPPAASSAAVSDPSVILSTVPESFYFSSGAGAWGTTMELHDDGTFVGSYHDSNMGEDTDNYPGGTVYLCDFSGYFTDFRKVDDYTWSMRLASLSYDNAVGDNWADQGIHYIASEAYGVYGGDLFYLYLPGHPVDTLPEGYMSWARMYMGYEERPTLGIYGIYNEIQQEGWGS